MYHVVPLLQQQSELHQLPEAVSSSSGSIINVGVSFKRPFPSRRAIACQRNEKGINHCAAQRNETKVRMKLKRRLKPPKLVSNRILLLLFAASRINEPLKSAFHYKYSKLTILPVLVVPGFHQPQHTLLLPFIIIGTHPFP